MLKRVLLLCGFLSFGLGLIWACGFDDTLRAYLDVRFWLPLSKRVGDFERKGVRRVSNPYAGVDNPEGPLANLREAYLGIAQPMREGFDPSDLRKAVAAARALRSLTSREREEVELIDAKIDMRSGHPD